MFHVLKNTGSKDSLWVLLYISAAYMYLYVFCERYINTYICIHIYAYIYIPAYIPAITYHNNIPLLQKTEAVATVG